MARVRQVKRVRWYLLLFVLVSGMGFSPALEATFGEVVASFPAPGGSENGLTWDGEYLWLSDSAEN